MEFDLERALESTFEGRIDATRIWTGEPARDAHLRSADFLDENRGDMRRIGFEATARINRHDFGVSWQDELPGGGLVVSDEIELTLDVEAIADDDLERTGAIAYPRDADEVPSEVQAGTSDAPG